MSEKVSIEELELKCPTTDGETVDFLNALNSLIYDPEKGATAKLCNERGEVVCLVPVREFVLQDYVHAFNIHHADGSKEQAIDRFVFDELAAFYEPGNRFPIPFFKLENFYKLSGGYAYFEDRKLKFEIIQND